MYGMANEPAKSELLFHLSPNTQPAYFMRILDPIFGLPANETKKKKRIWLVVKSETLAKWFFRF